ncbi:MAG: hypothetical protein Kapaf2KO_11640 [Candidatus Kapaibacteriales bacterium]
MENNINNSGSHDPMTPQEYEAQMAATYGPDWKKGFRIGFGPRFGAYLLDLVIVYLIVFSVGLVVGPDVEELSLDADFENFEQIAAAFKLNFQTTLEATKWFEWLDALIVLLFFLPEALFGYSIGKRVLNLRIADTSLMENKSKLIKRFFLKHSAQVLIIINFAVFPFAAALISSVLGFIIFIGCFFVIGKDKQALHDMLAGTAVFSEESMQWSNKGNG